MNPLLRSRWLRRIAEWSLLFLVLLLAIWAATQRSDAPQLILLLLLYITIINFGLPPTASAVSLLAVVSLSSLLVVGQLESLVLAVVGHFLAILAQPLWQPLWEELEIKRPSLLNRLLVLLIELLALTIAGTAFQQAGGSLPLQEATFEALEPYGALLLGYGAPFVLLTSFVSLIRTPDWRRFLIDQVLYLLASGLIILPFGLFGGISFDLGGLPIFIIFCLGIMAFSSMIWVSWRRQHVMQVQLTQFAGLNSASQSLRESLALEDVLTQTYEQVSQFVRADHFAIVLFENGRSQAFIATGGKTEFQDDFEPDDFTNWVKMQGRVLDLDQRNLHFAEKHQLRPPSPPPATWLGLPLTANEQIVGVMVLQQYPPAQLYTRWGQEVLLAIAGQASAAIQNARLYSETVRLYNLTDEALARRVEQLQALLNSMQEGVVLLNKNGRFTLVNPMAATLLGQPIEQLREQALTPKTAAVFGYTQEEHGNLHQTLQTGSNAASRRTLFTQAAPPRHIERSEAAVLTASGDLIGWLLLFRDVTEEQELAERRVDVTRMIVHDLRNPITTLMSTMSMLQTQLTPAPTKTMVELLRNAQRGCIDMLDMVDSLLDMTRIEAGRMVLDAEATYVEPLLEKVVKRIRPLAQQRRIELLFEMPAQKTAVWADEDMVRRVLINLIDNGLKFTPAGGEVHCRIEPDSRSDNGHEPGIRCIICDTGPGISAEHHERIFDRFMRTNEGGAQVRGTGLGLAFCKLAIEAHNGRIWVETAPQGGSCFVFTLPGEPHFVSAELSPK